KILKVDADNASTITRTQFLQEGSYGAPHVENLALRAERDIPEHEFFLLPVMPIHHPVEETRERAPVYFLPVGDVFVIVEVLDMLDSKPRVLIAKPAARAGNKGEGAGPAGKIVLSRKKGRRFRRLAVVTRNSLKVGWGWPGLERSIYWQGSGCHRSRSPLESASSGRPASSPTSAAKIHGAPRES